MGQKIKKRIYQIIEVATEGDSASRIFDIFIMTLIALNVVAVILETVEFLSARYIVVFRAFELCSVVIFTIEYMLRIWTCTNNEDFQKPFSGRIRFAFTPLALVDLIAILPFYLPMFFGLDLRFVRAVRLFRIFRLFKMGRYSQALRTLGRVIKSKKEDLLITAFIVVILLIVASSLMYFIEKEAQPEAFSSIPATMWWGMATLTTVGYGDIYPVTIAGKVLGAIISILGIGMFALPTGILASAFAEEIQQRRGKKRTCPHCGQEID